MLLMRYFSLFFLAAICINSFGETAQEALVRATAAVKAAAPRAEADPARPVFHVTAPAQWINDPNGPIFHNGYYHLFYQLHPYSDNSGSKYWGHVRSRDLAKWEHLPIAIAPSGNRGEAEIWSGCATINGLGQPMIFYTSIAAGKPAMHHAEQWAATSDNDLIEWHKSPANPVLTEALHGEKKVYDWRDPFVLTHDKKTFMVMGGSLNESKGGQAVVFLYEAETIDLIQWKYRGILFQHPDAEVRTAECPNFFQLDKEWVLFVSPYGKVQYFIGAFDAASGRFHPRARGLLDCGPNFYAPNTMLIPDGRRLVWGWVNGFPGGHGWNGCLSLPREISFSRKGELRQVPAPQLTKLRGKKSSWRNLNIKSEPQSIALPGGNTFELETQIDLQSAAELTLQIKSDYDAPPITIAFTGLELRVQDARHPFFLSKGDRELRLRIFVDRSVLEVFVNEAVVFTKTITPFEARALELSAVGSPAKLKRANFWPMNSIW